MNPVKTSFPIIVGLIVLYFIITFGWSLLNAQVCSYDLPDSATCEQMAENNAKNCKYVVLRWKTVDYEEELRECKEWEERQVR